jgi:ABC-type glycerol-3-phosphate transport system substrate-binding protein
MNFLKSKRMNRIDLLIGCLVVLSLMGIVACQNAVTANEQGAPPETQEATMTRLPVTETVVAQASPTVTPTATPEDNPVSITFWTVETLSPEAEGEPGRFIGNSLRAFERTNPNLEVNLILKKGSGKGGVVDFLRTAKNVAPSVLPDVAIMNGADLNQAFAEGLIQPLDGRLDRSIVQDLLPAARKMGTVAEQLAGVPVGLEMEHAVYNTVVFTTTPMLWTDVLSKNSRYLFPAKGTNGLVNDATLSQYFSAGGKLFDDQGNPKLDEQALRTVLDLYQQARERGVISPEILEAATTQELWPTYLEGRAGLAQVNVSEYLANRELLNNSTFAPIPVQTEEDTPVAITHGWVLVLVTDDPDRQKAALNLIEWFLSTNNNAIWNSIINSIPTRGSAYQQLAGDDPYWVFLIEQLNKAQPQPGFTGYDRVGRIIQQAVQQVISGEATPEEATATAIDALAQ